MKKLARSFTIFFRLPLILVISFLSILTPKAIVLAQTNQSSKLRSICSLVGLEL